jgi:hypothetical protein
MRKIVFSPRLLVRNRPVRGGAMTLLAAVVLFACQQKSPEEDLLQKISPIGSWLASLEMTGQKWAANSVPASFVRTTVGTARKELDKAAEEAAKSKARPTVLSPVRQLVAEARAASDGLRKAVEANDRPGVAREVGRLAQLHDRFEALQKALGGSS